MPRGLRAAGVDLVTLAERYGIPEDERILDVQWMRDAAAHGEAVLMCDDAIRRKNPEEQRVLVEVRLRAFVVSSRLSGAEVVRRFVTQLPAIERACRHDGPFVYRLLHDKPERREIRG